MSKLRRLEARVRLSRNGGNSSGRAANSLARATRTEEQPAAIAAAATTLRVLLCGGHVLVRAGLRSLIEGRRGLRVVGEIDNTAEAARAAAWQRPDVVILDLGSASADDPEPLRHLRACAPEVRVLALAPARDVESQRRAIRLGASTLVATDDAAEIFLSAIENLPIREPRSARRSSELSFTADEGLPPNEKLSVRELDVAGLVCQGLHNEQIAKALFISEATVRHHLTSIFAKRGVGSRAELIVDAYRSAFLR